MQSKVKRYVLDTNVFVYLINPSSEGTLRGEARYFWKKVKEEIEVENAVLAVPDEVRRELEIQSYTLTEHVRSKTNSLLGLCQEISSVNMSIEIEHKIRQLTAFVRARYKKEIGRDKMEYGGVSDARILYTAYVEESILVTANIKDFLLFPLLCSPYEERLYDITKNEFVTIQPDSYSKVHSDPDFRELLQEFYALDQELN